MILWMTSVGCLSAFALGPASFSIIRSLLNRRQWPWASIAGFLVGDVIYIALAVALLHSPWLNLPWLKTGLTALTAAALSLYSVKVLWTRPGLAEEQAASQGFLRSLMLTLSNFHLVLIYAGLFINLTNSQSPLWLGVLVYLSAFVASFLGLLWGLRRLQGPLKTFLRKIEVVAACGFLGFSLYLSLEIL